MKSVIIVALAAVSIGVFALPQGGPEEMHKQMEQTINNCLQQAGVNPSTLTPEKMDSDDAEIKCFHACMAKKSQIMNSDGTINKEALLTFPPDMPQDLVQHLTRQRTPCADLKGDNECETAFLLFRCMAPKENPGQ